MESFGINLKKKEDQLDENKINLVVEVLKQKDQKTLTPNEIYLLQTLKEEYTKSYLNIHDDNELTPLQLLIKNYKLSPTTDTQKFLNYKSYLQILKDQTFFKSNPKFMLTYNKIREDEAKLNEQRDAPVTSENSGILQNTRTGTTATSNLTTGAKILRQSRNTTLVQKTNKYNEQIATKTATAEEEARQEEQTRTQQTRQEEQEEQAQTQQAQAQAQAQQAQQEAAKVNTDQYINSLIGFFNKYFVNFSSTTVDPSLQQEIQNIEFNIENYINIIKNKNYFTIENMEKINLTRQIKLEWSAFFNIIKSLIRWCNFTFLQMMYNKLKTTPQFQDIIVSFLNFTIKSWIYDNEGFTYDNYISTYYNELVTGNDFIKATEKFLTDVKIPPVNNKRIGRTVIIYVGRECDTSCRINSWAIPDGKGSNFFKLMTDKAAAKQIDEDRTLSKWGKSSSLSSGTKSVQRLFGRRGGRKTRRQRRTKQRKHKVKEQKKTRKQRRKKTQKRRSKK
jgi:hypothetical protein